jgi:protease I
LEVPRDRLRAAGATVTVATPDGKNVKGWKDKNWGPEAEADTAIGAVSTHDFDALVIPGGQINPDILRAIPEAVLLVKDFAEAGKPIAAICHGPWLLVQADILKGRKATSYASIRTDLINAGAMWIDKDVVVDNGLVTSRSPEDLPAFVAKIIEEVEAARHGAAAA